MQNIEPFPAGLFWSWKGKWLRFGKPVCKIQRKGCWGGAHAEEILTQGLTVANRIEALERFAIIVSYLSVKTANIRIGDHLRKD